MGSTDRSCARVSFLIHPSMYIPTSHPTQYRWSGAERSSSAALREGKTSYCTWGRELIKQYIEDAIELVRTSLATGDWDK